nr:imelysin family protein [Pollutimonas bauzanensis]
MKPRMLALVLLLPAAISNAGELPPDLGKRLVQGYIAPAMRDFQQSASQLHTALQGWCAAPGTAGQQGLRDGYAQLVKSWSGIEFLRFGPLVAANRYEKINFWPDPRGITLRQAQGLLAQPSAVPDAIALASHSVAAQGLPALEYLLYRDGGLLAGQPAEEESAAQARAGAAAQAGAQTADSKMADAKTTTAKTTTAKTTTAKTTTAKTTTAKTTTAKTTDAKTTDAKTTDAKTTDAKTTDAKTTAAKTTAAKTTAAKTTAAAFAPACAYAVAIAGNLARLGTQLVDEWNPAGGYARQFSHPSPSNPLYRNQQEVAGEAIKALSTGLQFARDVKLLPVLGADIKAARPADIKAARPRRAAFWRSGLAIPSMAAAAAGMLRFYKAGGYQFGGGEAWIDASLQDELRRIVENFNALPAGGGQPGQAGPGSEWISIVDTEEGYRQLTLAALLIKNAKSLVDEDLAPALGVRIGFNALDGD